jgi:surface protein
MRMLFSYCYQLKSITPLANWDSSKVNNMEGMFCNCEQLQNIYALANWDISKVNNMEGMFCNCKRHNISNGTPEIKAHLRSFSTYSYSKQDHTSLLQSLWERVKPLLKDTTKLNNHFKGYTIEAPAEDQIKVLQKENAELKARLAFLEEKMDFLMSQFCAPVKSQTPYTEYELHQWDP